MIDFACKEFKIKEIIKCALGLTRTEIDVLRILGEKPEYLSSHDISEKLGINLSTSQRALKKLHEKSIAKRMQVNLDNGGYNFIYKIENQKKVQKCILDIIDNWVKRVKQEITKI